MAIKRSDYFVPEVLADRIQEGFPGVQALNGSPVAIVNFSLPIENRKGGHEVTVPYIGSIGEFEDVAEDQPLTPAAVSHSEEKAAVQRSGKAIEITAWAQIAAQYADPYNALSEQMLTGAARRIDRGLIAAARRTAVAQGMINDISAMVASGISYDAVVDTKQLWGDELEDENDTLLIAHSRVRGSMLKIKDTTGRPIFTDATEGKLARFAGLPLKFSDRLTPDLTTPDIYDVLMLQRGSVIAWVNDTPSAKQDEDILKDTDLAAVHIYFVTHAYKRLPGKTRPGVAILRLKA